MCDVKYNISQNHVSTNQISSPIVDDGYTEEIARYNKEIEDLGNPSWLDVPWLFSECYMYRYEQESVRNNPSQTKLTR